MIKPTVPMTAVEPVLMFRASCNCGWWTVTGSDEMDAKRAVILHTLATRCDGCSDVVAHEKSTTVDQGSWVGSFCSFCAPHYAAPAA